MINPAECRADTVVFITFRMSVQRKTERLQNAPPSFGRQQFPTSPVDPAPLRAVAM
jgi:hypothetical protein